jgi:hypothetical protein
MPLLPGSSSASIMESEQSTNYFLAKKGSKCIEPYVKVSNSDKLFEPSFLLHTSCCCIIMYIHGSTFLLTDFASMPHNTDRPPPLLKSAIVFLSRFSVINRTHVGHHQSFLKKKIDSYMESKRYLFRGVSISSSLHIICPSFPLYFEAYFET